jgi:hypothetical protein
LANVNDPIMIILNERQPVIKDRSANKEGEF